MINENDLNKNKKFLTYGSISQEEIDKIILYLKDSGMNDDDIRKVGEYKGWFYLNPLYDSNKEKDKYEAKDLK